LASTADGVLRQRVANPVEVIARATKSSAASDARIKQIQEENEALKAENRELRKQLERFNGIEEVLHTTGRLPW
jgi:regulator of replication initiation timing